MATQAKKKQFRSRRTRSENDDADEREPASPQPKTASRRVKEAAGTSTSSKMLSFGEDEEEEDEALRQALKARKAKNSKAMRKTLEKLEAEADQNLASGATAGYGASAGEYTAEKMAELRKAQPFQLPRSSKSSKASSNARARTTAVSSSAAAAAERDDGEEPEAPAVEAEGDRVEAGDGLPRAYDDDAIKRLKEKKERSRRAALGDFVPLNGNRDMATDDEDAFARRRALGGLELDHDEMERRMGQKPVTKAGGERDMDEWERELIRRGAGKGDSHQTSSSIFGGGGLRSGAVLGGPMTSTCALHLVSVEDVLRDLQLTKERIEQAHESNERAAEKARSELESVTHGLNKLNTEFEDTAERFQFFQEMREYVSSLCGCLREKEGMISELISAVEMTRRESMQKRWFRRVEDDQEEELQDLKVAGLLKSLNGYQPKLLSLRDEAVGRAKEVELDEFGRDKNHHVQKAREARREARLRRRRRVLDKVPKDNGKDVAEAEAQLTGAEDSDSEVEVTRARRQKLLEAAGVIFEDADDQYRNVDLVAKRFEMWKRAYRRDYKHAFVSMSLPQIMEPFVRLEMAGWDPLPTRAADAESQFLDGHIWYQRLFNYGQGIAPVKDEEDPDDRLVPQLVEKVALPMLRTALLESYDPMSSTHTSNSIVMLQHVLVYEPGKQALESLLQAPVIRLKQCIESLCVPLLAPVATEDAHHFQRRQVYRAVKLYRNLCMWQELLSARILAPLALEAFLNRVIAPALSNRLSVASGGGEERKVLVEVLSILQVLAAMTPQAWAQYQGLNKKELKLLLEGLKTGNEPLVKTIRKMEDAFGCP